MREIIARGELGKLGLIHSFNYTNYLYRPRRPEELDTSLGGGILSTRCRIRSTPREYSAAASAQRSRAARPSSIRRARPRRVAPRCCNSTTAPRRRSSKRLRPFRFRRMALRHRRARRAEADRRAAPPVAGQSAKIQERAPRPSPMARRAAICRQHRPHFGITIVTCARGRHARLGRRRHDLRPRRHARNRRSRAAAACRAAARCWTTCAPPSAPGRPPGARRPLGQGHRRGRARHPAIGARGPRGRAGTSGGGGRFQRDRYREIAKSGAPARRTAGARNARSAPKATAIRTVTATPVWSSRTWRT